MKKLVKLSSHALSDYQRCPRRFFWSHLRKLEPAKTVRAFNRGDAFTKMLESYYNDKRDGVLQSPLVYTEKFVNPADLEDADKILLTRIFVQYFGYYQKEEWVPVATEVPFSFVLFEDDNYIFIYEGSTDLLVFANADSARRRKITVADHKTYSVKSDIYPYNNQLLGYCHAFRTDKACYNYIGLTQTKKIADNFYRSPKIFSKAILDNWKEDTIQWFKRIADDEEYMKTLNCSSKYGLCGMTRLCESPNLQMAESLVKIYYRPNTYSSWGKEVVPDEE